MDPAVDSWREILGPQALDLALLIAFMTLALVSFFRKRVRLKHVTFVAAVCLYLESARAPLRFDQTTRVEVPTGILRCRYEAPFPPRSWAEHGYNVTRWTESQHGGHVAALEVPHVLANELRVFFGSDATNDQGRQARNDNFSH